MALRNIKLTISYDGSQYHGWQTQPGFKTIQQTLTDTIRDLVGSQVIVHGASRTDAGVSALGQVGLVEVDSPIPTENLAKAITDRLPPEIAIIEAEQVTSDFDLLGQVKSKLYRYTIFTGTVRPVLQINHCWHLPKKLDIAAMTEAAGLLVGKKDFKSFASADDNRENSVRTIFRCDVMSSHLIQSTSNEKTLDAQYAIRNTQYENDWIYMDTEGDGFLYNMVRNIVGTLTEIGRGRWKPEKMTEIIKACDRTAAGPIAPPQGLCLMWIKY